MYIEESRTEPWRNNTPGKNKDYYKNTKDHLDIEIASVLHIKNGFEICSQESLDSVRSINDNLITLEQHKMQELC